MKKMSLFGLAWPIFIEVFLHMLLGIIDVLILSGYDDLAAASVSTANQTITIVTLVFNVFSTASAVIISQNLGADNRDSASQAAALSIALQTLFGILLSLVFLFLSRPILQLIGAEGQLLSFSGEYLVIVGGSIVLQALLGAVSVIIRNHGLPKITMFVSVGMNLMNVILDLLLVPRMGVSGAAIATAISRGAGCLVLIILLFARVEKPSMFRLLIPFPTAQLLSMLKIGIPSAMESFLYNLSQLVITSIVLSFLTEPELIAKTYVQNVTMFFYLFAISIAQASQIMIGHLVGARKYEEASRQCFRSFRIALVITLLCSGAGILLRQQLGGLFTEDPRVIALFGGILCLDFLLEAGRTSNIVVISCMRGAGDVLFPTVCAIFSNWLISVLGSYLFAVVLGKGIYGMWAALAADECFRGVLMLLRWRSGKWKKKSVVTARN